MRMLQGKFELKETGIGIFLRKHYLLLFLNIRFNLHEYRSIPNDHFQILYKSSFLYACFLSAVFDDPRIRMEVSENKREHNRSGVPYWGTGVRKGTV